MMITDLQKKNFFLLAVIKTKISHKPSTFLKNKFDKVDIQKQ